jgi:hypothetical protein
VQAERAYSSIERPEYCQIQAIFIEKFILLIVFIEVDEICGSVVINEIDLTGAVRHQISQGR